MPTLSDQQAGRLADEFIDAAEAVSDYRFREGALLSSDEVQALQALELKLSNQADDFTARAITIELDNLDQTIKSLVDATRRAKEAIEKLSNIDHAILIAAGLVALGSAIAEGNPEGVLKAVQDTKNSLSAK